MYVCMYVCMYVHQIAFKMEGKNSLLMRYEMKLFTFRCVDAEASDDCNTGSQEVGNRNLR